MMRVWMTLLLHCLLPLSVTSLALTQEHKLAQKYADARNIRLRDGHEAALPVYQELLRDNPSDMSAATRLAISSDTPARHDEACPYDPIKIQKLRKLLMDNNYNHKHIKVLFGISDNHKLASCVGPVYLTPASAGSVNDSPSLSEDDTVRPLLQCLVSLFLLGISVRCDVLSKYLGPESVQLFQDLGLAFPCSVDSNLLVPHVHLFPMQVSDAHHYLILATDLHPRVLSSTTAGTHGAVMYIGPDSLALVRNLPQAVIAGDISVLDLCTGSGVQALAALVGVGETSTALCVDINERALRFVKFNAALNGLEDRVSTLQANLITETATNKDKPLVQELKNVLQHTCTTQSTGESRFNVILANPPFIPVPPDNDVILQRYGLFSSGGPDGEDVLRAIMILASDLISPDGGFLGIISEFMNPPTDISDDSLLKRLQQWWSGPEARGVLFTNEFAVSAETYATRRADSRDEKKIWQRHLAQLGVTHVSPGLLIMSTDSLLPDTTIMHEFVPKSRSGSIWTPSNNDAVECIRLTTKKKLGLET